ncbi:MAG TPA: hypothetical protein VEQ42_05110 [Pyrinomonadaceae bacterium]|nr:hypothetical protein [Pyrinomonadaceae bacterium]
MKQVSAASFGRASARASVVFVASSVVLAFALAGDAGAQARRSRAPRFEDYPVRRVYRGPVARVRLDSPRARMFRTRLREGASAGPNFAGRYTFVQWGCGTGCAQSGVVDAATGRVFFPPLDFHDIYDMEDAESRRRVFRLDSRLLVLTKFKYDRLNSYDVYYYLFDGRRFRLLRQSVERQTEPENEETRN